MRGVFDSLDADIEAAETRPGRWNDERELFVWTTTAEGLLVLEPDEPAVMSALQCDGPVLVA